VKLSSSTVRSVSERGWSLPAVLFASALLAASLTLITSEALSIVRRAQSFSFGEKLRRAALSTAAATSLPFSGCDSINTTLKDTTLSVFRCAEDTPQFASSPAVSLPQMLVDYDAIFRLPTSCPGIRRRLDRTTFTAPTAASTCMLRLQRYSSLRLLDNIQADSLLLAPQSQGETSFIATPGSLTITEELSVSSSTVIIAGGDIEIGNVRHDGDSPVKITIFSSRGGISVPQVRGKVSLLAIGRGERSIPPTSFVPPFPLPPLRARSIYGLSWGE
jgi:hypothetical protein